jgi:hypothetical protein
MNFGDVQFALAMREDLFNEVTDIWPYVLMNSRIQSLTAAGTPANTDSRDLYDMRNDMRNGRYLPIDGVNVPVILDDGIPEDTSTTNSNVPEASYSSDIYLLPLTVRGSFPVLFYEYFDYNSGAAQAISQANLGGVSYVSDGGRFLWYHQFTNGCFSMAATLEPRLRLLTPQLAGRLQNVIYSPLQHLREPFTDDAYYTDGGDTSRSNLPYAASAVS